MAKDLPRTIGTRLLAPPDLIETPVLHRHGLPRDLVVRCGERFLARFHLAFAQSPHAMAIVADDRSSGRVVGLLLGTLDTPAHRGFVVRRHGLSLAAAGLARAVWDPSLGKDLLKGRATRYARSTVGASPGIGRRTEGDPEQVRKGLLARVVVRASLHGRGIGAALVSAYEARAREAGLERLELVALPDERGVGAFCERLGWARGGELTGKGGGRLALYTRDLDHGEDLE